MKLKLIPRRRLVNTLREMPEGYRSRVRRSEASLSTKRENLYKAIENTAAFMNKRRPTQPLMDQVRRYYPAPQYFLESDKRELQKHGLSRLDAFYYAMIPDLTRTWLSQQWGTSPRLSNAQAMGEYLKTLYVGIHVECFYLILLNGQGRLIRSVLLQRGGIDNAPFYLGQVISVALAENAKYIVLAHNHPGGTRKPSKEDLHCTLRALNAFATLRIPLLDHMIVTRDMVVSVRNTGLISSSLWAIPPNGPIVRNWLKEEEAST